MRSFSGHQTRSVIVLLVVLFHSRRGLGSRRKATIDLSLPFAFIITSQLHPYLHFTICSQPCYSLACGRVFALAPSDAALPRAVRLAAVARRPVAQLGTKERLLLCRPAAAAATATIVTVIYHWTLLCAFPPTSRRCYRTTKNASQVRLIMSLLTISFFLPGSRAALVTTNGTNSDAYVGGRQLADTNNQVADGSQLAEISDISVWQSLAKVNLPWILGGLLLVTVAGTFCHMMPGLGGGSRTENFNYRIPPSWSPENDSSYSFRAYMTDISLWVMLTDLAPHQQCAAIIMRLGGQARELARMISPQEIVTGGRRDGRLLDPATYLLGALQLRFASLEEETRLQSD